MANVNNANGLWPVNGLAGGVFSGRIGRYYVPATDTTAIYLGGVVKPAGSADTNGIMSVTGKCTTGDAVVGVVVGIEMVTRESTLYRVASTERYVFVADDPSTVFEVQDDAGTVSAAADVGNVADLKSFTTGSTATARSAIEISMAAKSASGDGTEDVIMMGLVQRPTNAFGANARWLVRLNNHFYVDASPGA